ncbi:MAG: hypothetical protein WC822_01305 [Candidatus Paceibacterota bacterium]|jgi:hypothetical protein
MTSAIEYANGHMNELMGSLRTEMKKLAPNPSGVRERSNQEQAQLFRSITKLPEGEMKELLADMAARAGHSPYEEKPCEVCDMVATYGLGIK